MDTKTSNNSEKTPQIPVIDTHLRMADILNGWRVRWGIGRNRYRINPGLHALGRPDKQSPVLVTANYKLSFDLLRKELGGYDAWILVLDTKGINVWCAAGKGTFGTVELIKRIMLSDLAAVVDHKTVVIPQLGAPGIAAHEVRRLSGFRVMYGPVRAADLPAYLDRGMKASPEMRRITFKLGQRLQIVPVELVQAFKWLPPIFGIILLLKVIGKSTDPLTAASIGFLPFAGAVLVGTVIFPILLPYLPGRAFSLKGWILGLAYSLALMVSAPTGWLAGAGQLLLLSPIVAFLALNFTGASTFTSLSGVKKEMRLYVPTMIGAAVLGIVLKVIEIL